MVAPCHVVLPPWIEGVTAALCFRVYRRGNKADLLNATLISSYVIAVLDGNRGQAIVIEHLRIRSDLDNLSAGSFTGIGQSSSDKAEGRIRKRMSQRQEQKEEECGNLP